MDSLSENDVIFPGTERQRYKIYEDGIYAYGFLTLCYLIQGCAYLEFYEECALIKKVLDDTSEKLSLELPTVYSEELLQGSAELERVIPERAIKLIKQINKLK